MKADATARRKGIQRSPEILFCLSLRTNQDSKAPLFSSSGHVGWPYFLLQIDQAHGIPKQFDADVNTMLKDIARLGLSDKVNAIAHSNWLVGRKISSCSNEQTFRDLPCWQ